MAGVDNQPLLDHGTEFENFVFGSREDNIGGIKLSNGRHRGIDGNQGAFALGFHAGNAADRRAHRGIIKIELRRFDLGFGQSGAGFHSVKICPRLVARLFADNAFLKEFGYTFPLGFGCFEISLVLRKLGLSLQKFDLKRFGIYLKQHVAFPDL